MASATLMLQHLANIVREAPLAERETALEKAMQAEGITGVRATWFRNMVLFMTNTQPSNTSSEQREAQP